MDIKVKTIDVNNDGLPFLDFEVSNGIVPIIEPELEKLQRATLSSFLIKGTVPTLPEVGVPWNTFLTGTFEFTGVDTSIQENLQAVDCSEFYPDYTLVNGRLQVTITKGEKVQ